MPQNSCGCLVMICGPGHDAVDGHGADHQRHHGVGRDAEREQRNEGGLRAGVVGRFRPGDALDGAAAEARGILGELLLQRVGGERPEHGAVAGQQARGATPRQRAAQRSGQPTAGGPRGWAAAGRWRRARRRASASVSRLRRISAKPNMPMASTATSMPSEISLQPKVRRSSPLSRSVPTVESRMPSRIMAIALGTEPRASTTANIRPSTISEK